MQPLLNGRLSDHPGGLSVGGDGMGGALLRRPLGDAYAGCDAATKRHLVR